MSGCCSCGITGKDARQAGDPGIGPDMNEVVFPMGLVVAGGEDCAQLAEANNNEPIKAVFIAV